MEEMAFVMLNATIAENTGQKVDWEGRTSEKEKSMTNFKDCPYCGEEILAKARKCKHCYTMLENLPQDKSSPDENVSQPQLVTAPSPITPAAERTEEPITTPPPPPLPEGALQAPPPPTNGNAQKPATGSSGQNQQQTEKKSSGCLKGCLIVVLVLIVLAILLFVVAYFMRDAISAIVVNYFHELFDQILNVV